MIFVFLYKKLAFVNNLYLFIAYLLSYLSFVLNFYIIKLIFVKIFIKKFIFCFKIKIIAIYLLCSYKKVHLYLV